jgi:hypothetical protein
MKKVLVFAQHTVRAGQVAEDLRGRYTNADGSLSDDVFELDAEQARAWEKTTEPHALGLFMRHAAAQVFEYLGY